MLASICKRSLRLPYVSLTNRLATKAETENAADNEPPAPEAQRRLERSVNLVVLMGRVGLDPEVRGTEERQVATFPLATSENFKDANGNWSQRTLWHRISIFKPTLRDYVARNVRRGDKIHVQGRLSYRQVTMPKSEGSKDEPVTYQAVSVLADDVVNLTWNAYKGKEGKDTKEDEIKFE